MTATKKKKRGGMKTLVPAALALCFTYFIFAPAEQYMLNQSEMWFSLWGIVPQALLTFAVAMVVLCLIGYLLPVKMRRAMSAVLISLALCFYLQGNFLNADYGELDGRAILWQNYKLYAVLDTLFWLLVPIGLLIFAFKKRKLFHKCTRFIALVMVLIQVITLSTVFLTRPVEDKSLDWIVSEKDAFKMAPQENTVMFVVDACDLTYLPQIRDTDPEALKAFDGFTYFADYAGSYSKTKMGLVYLLTGEWYNNDETIEGYIDRAYDNVALYDTLIENGFNTRIYTSETYVSRSLVGRSSNIIEANLTIGSHMGVWSKMLEFVSFRYMPHLLKPAFTFYSGEFGDYKSSDGEAIPFLKDNFAVIRSYDEKSLTVSDEYDKSFSVYHINGSHLPCDMDAYGNYVGSWNATAVEQTRGVFRFLGRIFDDMKKAGLYDSANIIITADHGRFDEGPSSPILLIKPAGSTGDIIDNHAMAHVSDMHATILKLCNLPYEGTSVFDLDESEERTRRYLYYPTTRENGGTLPLLTEYNVGRGQAFTETGVTLPGGADALK
ncbi:MAG: alkaline phosphatase family protein [Clostridia bacterium]|nr:alkaline phosphatase family protein [Clostridia bacterium]